jgi:hypothetical protein
MQSKSPLNIRVHGQPAQAGAFAPVDVAFEELFEKLSSFPRLFIEPDGSFVWSGEEPSHWRLEGMIYDDGARVQYLELKGTCPLPRWQALLAELRTAPERLSVNQLDSGRVTNAAEFAGEQWGNQRDGTGLT